jgi:ferrous iron transport protein A
MTLKEAKIGQTVKVVRLGCAGKLRRRLLDMGITKDVAITVRKVAPLGDPLELTVRGYELSLRREEAEAIEVEA